MTPYVGQEGLDRLAVTMHCETIRNISSAVYVWYIRDDTVEFCAPQPRY